MPNENYQIISTDWRKSLRQNRRRSLFVIILFFIIYGAIGLLVDMSLVSSSYPAASLTDILWALITLQLFPLATAVMLIIALISLLISYALHDKLMLLGTNYKELTADNADSQQEKQLYNVVEEMKIAAGLSYLPKVYIIQADYMNAFASGYSEKSAMVAITSGLMEKLNRDELQAVMAHELSHVRHLDIKLTLTASLLANLSIIMIDILFYNAMFSRTNSNNNSRNTLVGIIILLRYLLPITTVLLLLYLSRKRELMADAGCVELMRNNEPLAKALIKISNDHEQNRDKYTVQYQQTPHENVRREAYLFDPLQAGIKDITSISDIFSTHPTLDERLASIGYKRIPS